MVYTEGRLPPNRTQSIRSDSAFSGLDYAIYLGDREDTGAVLTSSRSELPLHGRHRAIERFPFGDSTLTLVMVPSTVLGGALLHWLPLLVGLVGIATTFGAAALTEVLARRRDVAVDEADENAHLYWAQRSVARTLQHSLLPDRLPHVDGLEFAAAYIAGVAEVEIGGDWYDVIEVGDRQVMIVVGDVSGRGLPAATVMGSLRHAIRAFASEGHGPAVVLSRLSRLVDLDRDGHFATVLVGLVDIDAGTLTVASAGHPAPLLARGGIVTPADVVPGVPIGVNPGACYTECTSSVAPGTSLFLFTDGLFERRGESIDAGLARLRSTIGSTAGALQTCVSDIVARQETATAFDDTAILGVRWTT